MVRQRRAYICLSVKPSRQTTRKVCKHLCAQVVPVIVVSFSWSGKKQTFVRVFLFCHPSARLRSSSCCFDGQLLPVLSSEIEFALLYARGSETTRWPAL